MRISDWSSDVCSSDLRAGGVDRQVPPRLAVDGGAQHFQQADIVALGARGFGDREQPRRAGIVGLVERMPEAGQRPLRATIVAPDPGATSLRIGRLDALS